MPLNEGKTFISPLLNSNVYKQEKNILKMQLELREKNEKEIRKKNSSFLFLCISSYL